MSEINSTGDDSLSQSALELIDQICDRYEDACRKGERPRVEAFLGSMQEPVRSALLRELLRVLLHYLQADQRQRWQRGERVSVTRYLDQTPALREHAGLVFELICHEVLLREEREEAPRLGYYLRRFPHHEEQLRRFFAARNALPLATMNVPSGRATLRPARLSIVADPQITGPELPGQTSSSPHALPVVPGYEVLALLGRGAMGVVYKARQINAGRIVALKMVLAGGHASPEQLARFRAEGEAIARLQHPHVVQIFEVGIHQGLPFFSLEFCPAGSLDKKLAGTPLPPPNAADLIAKLARGVQAAHEAQVVHRDLKPANVLLAEDGTPKVGDFGLAKKLDEQGGTGTGAIMGTPSYMAPEQASGKSKEVGPAADVYALGAILYECLTGRPPFKAATVWDTLAQVLSDEPVPPVQLNAQVPRDLETICLKCLCKEASQRYGSAVELADDLGRFRHGEPILARPVGSLERVGKWVKRNRWVSGLAAAAVLALVSGTVVSWLFYLDAHWQTGEAKKHEQDATLAKRKSDDYAKRVTQVNEELKTALIDGTLRSVGQKGAFITASGDKSAPLDPSEIEALKMLGNLSSDDTCVGFIEKGLQSARTAKSLERRAEWVIQAAVGLDAGRRRRVEEVLTRRLQERDTPEEVKEACVRLGNALDVKNPSFNGLAAETLLAAIAKSINLPDYALLRNVNERRSLAQALQVVGGRLEPAPAAKVFDDLLAALAKSNDPPLIDSLAQVLQVVVARLEVAQAAKVADALVAAIAKNNYSGSLDYLLRALQAVCGRLDADGIVKVAETLIVAMPRITDPRFSITDPRSSTQAKSLSQALQALQAVSEPLATSDIVKLLQHPLAAEDAQRALLDVLGHRTRRTFRNTWHFLDWAHSNGVDFIPPAPLDEKEP
ncbi:MAG TPA: serine/threonine-protein kinase [Gemmataceae bacterium]|jgi:hypothetical protein